MSSLAAARADNFYFPPDYRPEYGGLSKFNHPDYKGSNQYQQHGVVRFELPFDGWCLKCSHHMSKGLRFNAKKDKEGKYFSTQIWSFTMKCPSCSQELKIRTNPKDCTYDFAEGIRKHEQDYIPDVEDNIVLTNNEEMKQLLAVDPMFRLQHHQEDSKRVVSESERFRELVEVSDIQHKDYYDLNAQLRSVNRKRKKRDIELTGEAEAKGLGIKLLEPSRSDSDEAKAALMKSRRRGRFEASERLKLRGIAMESIFPAETEKSNSRPVDGRKSIISCINSSTSVSSHRTAPFALKKKMHSAERVAQLITKAPALSTNPQLLRSITSHSQSHHLSMPPPVIRRAVAPSLMSSTPTLQPSATASSSKACIMPTACTGVTSACSGGTHKQSPPDTALGLLNNCY